LHVNLKFYLFIYLFIYWIVVIKRTSIEDDDINDAILAVGCLFNMPCPLNVQLHPKESTEFGSTNI